MARKRDPRRDEAFEIWKSHYGDITNRAIAEKLDMDEKKIAVWKQRDKWNVVQQNKNSVVQQKKNTPNKSKNAVTKEERIIEDANDELTDKQRFFCMYYLKYFSATKAYQKAYDCNYNTANAEGYKHLVKPCIKNEISRMKKERAKGIMLDASFVLQKYIDIAFADITDFVMFGKKEVQAMGAFGPLEDDDGNPVMVEINYVDFKESTEVDGTIITEVKKGKDGVSVKLADKMKALEKLSLYFDLFPDNFKRQVEEEKLKIAHHKAFKDNEDEVFEDDGFEDALNAATSEVWANDNPAKEDD
ncbi:terminase [Bacillus sp. RO3]|nr:terminase [Bacillus sp. RO3]